MNNLKYSIPNFAITPGFFRRLAAILYDGLLLFALMAVATTLITLPFGMPTGEGLFIYQFFLFEIIPLIFFSVFWVRGGQTLGMRAWKLKLVRADGDPVLWSDAIKRYLSAHLTLLALGLGFLWIFVDPQRLAWHDRLSNTRLILI